MRRLLPVCAFSSILLLACFVVGCAPEAHDETEKVAGSTTAVEATNDTSASPSAETGQDAAPSESSPEAPADEGESLAQVELIPIEFPYPLEAEPQDLYLRLMKLSLTDFIYANDPKVRAARLTGTDWPDRALTMIGLKRLDNLQFCIEDVIENNVPGDLLEAGAWRGGATIFMRAVLQNYGVTDRVVWVADSFEGLPPPNPDEYPADEGLDLSGEEVLAVSVEQVQRNFERYGLLDDQVQFLKGWFKDTFPTAPIEKLAVLRLDGDLYESTMDSLVPLYPKLSPGGYCIIDDYSIIPAAKQAVHDYRMEHGITDEIVPIDDIGVYWQKSK